MVTLVSIKLTGESNIIDDNSAMKQADEMSQECSRDTTNFNVFSILCSDADSEVCSQSVGKVVWSFSPGWFDYV